MHARKLAFMVCLGATMVLSACATDTDEEGPAIGDGRSERPSVGEETNKDGDDVTSAVTPVDPSVVSDPQPDGANEVPEGTPSTPETPTDPAALTEPSLVPEEVDCSTPSSGAGAACNLTDMPCAEGAICSEQFFVGLPVTLESGYCYPEPRVTDDGLRCEGSNEIPLNVTAGGTEKACVPLGRLITSFDIKILQQGQQPGMGDMVPLGETEEAFNCQPFLEGAQKFQMGMAVSDGGSEFINISFSALKIPQLVLHNVSLVIAQDQWVEGRTLELEPSGAQDFAGQVLSAEMALSGMNPTMKTASLEGLAIKGRVTLDSIEETRAQGTIDVFFSMFKADLDPSSLTL